MPRKPVKEEEAGAEEGYKEWKRGVTVSPRREGFTKDQRSAVSITTKRKQARNAEKCLSSWPRGHSRSSTGVRVCVDMESRGLKDRWPERMEAGPMPLLGQETQGMSPYTLSRDDTFQKQMTHWRRSRPSRVHRWYQKPL